jgi:hypothetical protein
MSKPIVLKDPRVISIILEGEIHDLLKELADLETARTGHHVSVVNLIRCALRFVYTDNERMRECFRRTRAFNTKRFKW